MLLECWTIWARLAPWLLLGMLISGLMGALLPSDWIRRRFHGYSGVFRAVLLGVPLPLCSCGVIPAGVGLRQQGASKGAALGFLISTPQTGIDSVLVSVSFFGWPFAIVKMLAAAVTGLAGGCVLDLVEPEVPLSPETVDKAGALPCVTVDRPSQRRSWLERFKESSVEILRSIWVWLVFGVLVSALINQYLPVVWVQNLESLGWLPSILVVLLLSIPLYVCATASVPIAAALVSSGLSPAAALVFLMAGPATNVSTIGVIYGRFGWRSVIVYLVTILVGSIGVAWLFDGFLLSDVSQGMVANHHVLSFWESASGIVLLCLVGKFVAADLKRFFTTNRMVDGDVREMTLDVIGMTCGNCVQRVETSLQQIAGIQKVVVDLKSETATIWGDPNPSEVIDCVERLGFRATNQLQGK
ncbi:MAG: hypothetical protein GY748_02470 [Planctomycetaceae bacterium]|nr:hypothetical protein [Planctomycetaceae bacterium]